MPEQQPAQDARQLTPCNLVMKGAIVSGVVYPSAITQLKDYHVFRNIGGTSAGAIAAAAAAGAEYRRQKAISENDFAHQNDGFTYLEQLSTTLMGQGFLFSLFQPDKTTKPLLDILTPLLALLQQGKPAADAPALPGILQVIQRQWPQTESGLRFVNDVLQQWESDYAALAEGKSRGTFWGGMSGAVLGALFAFALTGIVALFVPERLVLAIVLLASLLLFGGSLAWLGESLGTWLVGIAMAIIGLYDLLTNKVRDNRFGICIGHTDGGQPDNSRQKNLTDWLYQINSEMAGLPASEPLTFGHLKEQGITLRMVTSNISHGRPYVMPEGLMNFNWYAQTTNNLQKLLELCCDKWQYEADNSNKLTQDGVVLQVVPEC